LKTIRSSILALVVLALSACQSGKEAAKPPVRLGDEVLKAVTDSLSNLKGPVTLHLYLGGPAEKEAGEARALVAVIDDASPAVTAVLHDLDKDPDARERKASLGVDHGPVIVIQGPEKRTLVFYGFPDRKELQPFLDGILAAAGRPVPLPREVDDFLAKLDREVLIRIFTTPD